MTSASEEAAASTPADHSTATADSSMKSPQTGDRSIVLICLILVMSFVAVISVNVLIKDNEKKQLSKLIFNKQNIILILIAILFSPMVIGVRFICCKIDKIENRKIKAVIKVIGFVVFSSYLVSLKENVAYLLIGIFSLVYLLYQFYLSGLETK